MLFRSTFRWDDLQLSVYHRNLTEKDARIHGRPLQVGYIVLPATGQAEALVWENYEEVKAHADAAIDRICERIAKIQPKHFQPAPKPARYPVLEAYKGRKPELYMDIRRLGDIREKGASA